MTTRREFLSLAAAGGGALIACKPLAAPALVRGEITPQAFGARGGDPVADTLGWNRAISEGARTGRPVTARGTYALRVPARSGWNWLRRPSAPVHVAVELLSGTTIQAQNATILTAPPERPPTGKDERHLLFGTGLNLRDDALSGITVEGLTFDFHEELGEVHRFTYAVGVTGVNGLTRRNCTFRSTGTIAGRGLLCENARNRRDIGLRHANIVQGTYTRYERGVTMRDIAFDGFNEALDFDGPCWDVQLSDLSFRRGYREAQCIDAGGGARWLVERVTADDTGPVMYIYAKGNAWPTYAQWLASDEGFTPDYVPPSRMIVRGVRGTRVNGRDARKGEALRVGTYRTPNWQKRQGRGGPGPSDITVADWTLTDSGPIVVNDCRGLRLSNVAMTRPVNPDTSEGGAGALVIHDAPVGAGGGVSGTISGVRVSEASGPALNATADDGLAISDVVVRNRGGGLPVRLRPRPGGRAAAPRLTGLSVNGAAARPGDIDR